MLRPSSRSAAGRRAHPRPGGGATRESFSAGDISANVRSLPSGHEDRVPSEAAAPRGAAAMEPSGFPARGHDLAPVVVGDGADRGRAPILERVEHARKRGDAGAGFSTHFTRAPGKPPHARMARPLSSTRTGRDSIAYAERAFCRHDVRRIESLRLGELDVQPLDRETEPLRLTRLFGAARHEDDRQPLHAGILTRARREWRRGSRRSASSSAPRIPGREDLVERNLRRQPLEREEAELGHLEAILDRGPGLRADDDVAGLRDELLDAARRCSRRCRAPCSPRGARIRCRRRSLRRC